MLTEKEVMRRLKSAVADAGGQRRFAEAHNFTVAYVNDVLHGRRAMADRILATIGIERTVVTWVEYQEMGQRAALDALIAAQTSGEQGGNER